MDPDEKLELAESMLELEFEKLRAVGTCWNHEALDLGTWGQRLALVSRWLEIDTLAELEDEAIQLFPRMLLPLWDALSAGHHGDLNGSNIVIARDRSMFALIDPGASIMVRDESEGEREQRERLFLTTPASYPVLMPTPHGLLKERKTLWDMFGDLYSWSRDTNPGTPSAADLHAIGMLYYNILTQRHPFPWFEKRPLWFTGKNRYFMPGTGWLWETYSRVVLEIEPGHFEPVEIWESWVSDEERELAMELVTFGVRSRAQLEALVQAVI